MVHLAVVIPFVTKVSLTGRKQMLKTKKDNSF